MSSSLQPNTENTVIIHNNVIIHGLTTAPNAQIKNLTIPLPTENLISNSEPKRLNNTTV